ncbi:MAG: cytochrome c oxidase subunit I [Chloroflexi bacterium]|nr:cytochrome c oxidase subunit I [Chloroflexota bacterium]
MATVAAPVPAPHVEPYRPTGLLRWVTTVDHKDIGLLYILTSLAFFVVGGTEALLMRIQLAVPRNNFITADSYNVLVTMHGTTMIFLVIMPVLLGFANYIVPLQIGAKDMAFPRLNAFSYWLFLFGGLILYFGFIVGTPPNTGWFSYAPLTEKPYTMEPNADYWALGLLVSSAGTIATGLNLFVTVITMRVSNMGWFSVPVFSWMSLVTGWLILAALPSLTAAQVMLMFDRYLGSHFFDVGAGGTPLLYEHLFWYFGHPEVYILALPGFGIISEVVPVFSRKPLFGYPVVVASGAAIAVLSVSVWAHHMFTVGMGQIANAFFGAASMTIAVPTGIKVFSWLGTLWGGRIRLTVPMMYALAMIFQFAMGGVTGVMFASVPVDWATHNTYFLVAHFHYVIGGGTLFAILAAAYYWFPKMTGRLLDERLGMWNFWLTCIGFNLTFFPMHILGLMGMSRWLYTYDDYPGWGALNFVETVGAFMMGIATLILLWNVWKSLHHGRVSGDNPWNAWTLEWATTSPPPAHNFVALPPVTSARPLWDLQHGPTEQAPAQAPRRRADPTRGWHAPLVGIGAFIFSEATFFGCFIVAFLLYRTRSPSGPTPHDLDVPRTAIFSIFLFASSATIYMAERRLARDNQRAFLTWWAVTILFGVIFLVGQLTEYLRLISDGITISSNLFTTAFYSLTGFHGLHVFVGLIALSIVWFLGRKGDYRFGRRHVAVQTVSIYWHFVDAVWVVVFSLVYIWGLFA